MAPQETPSNIVALAVSILGAILSILPFKDIISITAGIGAVLAAIFSIINSYYSTKVSKQKLKHDNETLDSK